MFCAFENNLFCKTAQHSNSRYTIQSVKKERADGKFSLKGANPPMITPLPPKGDVDYEAFAANIELNKRGSAAITLPSPTEKPLFDRSGKA
jgi:hypothetical protein